MQGALEPLTSNPIRSLRAARPRGDRLPGIALASLLALAACRGKAPPTTSDASAPGEDRDASAPIAASASPSIATSTSRGPDAVDLFIKRSIEALDRWKDCDTRDDYNALRRSLASAQPFIAAGAKRAAEVLYGPPRPSDEGAGALGALDAALAAHDCKAAESQRFQIASSLALARREVVDARRLNDAGMAQVLSDAAYELGLAVLEARTSSSNFDEADRAEALGLTDAIDDGTESIFPGMAGDVRRAIDEVRSIRSAIEAAPTMTALTGRARIVRLTGDLGLAIRGAARARGMSIRGPYRGPASAADAAVSAISLPPPRRPIDADLAAIGARLFADPRLSSAKQRSCATCHDPAHAYAEPRPVPASLDPAKPLERNTPTLLYNGLHATQLWDGRVITAEAQALRVVHNHAELGIDDAELVARVKADPGYTSAFAARGPEGVTAAGVAAALGAHIASLGTGSAPIDAFARGDDASLSAEASRGLDVFAGRGRCARCHVPPFWGGSRPTDFAVPVYAVLGVPKTPADRALDGDPGRFAVTHRDLDKGAFKTPTLRDIARTAPYMHHGRFATLEQVVDFYDRGGGRGMGLTVPNQDPDVRPLRLSPEDRRALLAFLREGLLDAR